MQFSIALIAATAALISSASADGIFSITGSAVVSSPLTVNLQVLNGVVGDPPTCSGSSQSSPLPSSGTIPCNEGYSLSWTWDSIANGIQATYGTPTAPPFTYNVPNLGCDGNTPNTCQFGFTDNFPDKKVKRSFNA